MDSHYSDSGDSDLVLDSDYDPDYFPADDTLATFDSDTTLAGDTRATSPSSASPAAVLLSDQFGNTLDEDLFEEDDIAGTWHSENSRTVSEPESLNTNSNSPNMVDTNSNSPNVVDTNSNSPNMVDTNSNSPNTVDTEPSSPERNAEEAPVSLQDIDALPAPQRELAATTSTHRRRSPDGPPAKIQKTCSGADVADRTDPEDDGQTCSICLEAWSTTGEHRLVALKCGHLFGRSCILRWLNSQPPRERKCPTCKSKAAVRDMRCIYARKLIAADAAEVDALKQQLERTKGEKARVELELQTVQLKQRMYVQQLTDMRALVNNLKSSSSCTERRANDRTRWHFSLEKTLDLAGDSSCRVITYNSRKYELYASHKSTLNLFPGFGIRKIDCINMRLGQFVYVHPKAIRDIQYSSINDLTASVSLDKTAKLICGRNNIITATIKTTSPLWSCCWDCVQPQKLYVGGPGGVTLLYDMRNLSAPADRWTVAGDVSPIISLASTRDGFLACHLNSCWFYRRSGGVHRPHLLPLDGPFLSLSYEEASGNVLVSCRPTASGRHATARHVLAHLAPASADDDGVDCRTLHTFSGSSVQTLLSRSCQLRLGAEEWVAAHNESASAVSLYSTDTYRLAQSLSAPDTVLDMRPLAVGPHHYLATLSSNKARIYKANTISY